MATEPIQDYWNTKVTVDLIYKSAGAFVYLELTDMAGDSEFARLTPDQALELAEGLKAAAEEAL